MEEQLNLFDETKEIHTKKLEKGKDIKSLFVIKDNKEENLIIEEIFDSKLFNEIYAITYVSSSAFFSKYMKGFKKISIIIGIDDSGNLEKFTNGLALKNFIDVDARIEFWNELDENIKNMIKDRKLEIRFGKPNYIIHDKIYLLKNSENSNVRVIMGSANFTNNAFLSDRQFESIKIDDNDEKLFKLYLDRFMHIYEYTFDFIPDRLKNIEKEDKAVLIKDGEISKEILLDEIKKHGYDIVIEEKSIEEFNELAQNIEYQKETIDKTNEIINLITRKKDGKIQLKTKAQLEKKSIAIKAVLCKTSKKSESIDIRPYLLFNKATSSLFKGQDKDILDDKYCDIVDIENIKKSLIKIDHFINAYEIFAINPNKINQSKIYELILYSFLSPYIWKIRNQHILDRGVESVRSDFPPFMFIGGVAGSGKTTALEFVSLLLGNNGTKYFKYAKDIAQAGPLFDFFHSHNLFPILVDEIEPSFFHKSASARKGESLIKSVSNDLSTPHPVLIGTTNLREFSSSSQILRRIYYLEINNVFDSSKKAQSIEYLSNILDDVDDSLFRDFLYRFSRAISEKDELFKTNDFLYLARKIFKDYYKECGIEIPIYFPERIFNDYEQRKVNIWRNLFSAHNQFFKENAKGTLYVYLDEIFKNSKTKKDRDIAINFLDETCIIENNAILELNKEKFYKFIGHEESKRFYNVIKDMIFSKKM